MASRLTPSGDAAAQTPPPRLWNLQRIEHGVEQAGVAEPRRERPAPGRRRRLHGEREHFRVGRLGVTATEALEPRLRLLADLAGASAEYRAEIGIFGDFAGLVRTEIGATDGDRIFGPQAQLLARGVGGEEQAAADLLAGHVEKDRRRMQDRWLRALETGRKQAIERAFAGRARRFVGGVAASRRLAPGIDENRLGHQMALMGLASPLTKPARARSP